MAIQGSDEWLMERCGFATASHFADILAKGQGKTRAAYMRKLVAERITGRPRPTYSNGHMARGNDQEPFAKIAYMAERGVVIDEVGFVRHPEIMAGASPDGLIGDDGGCEVKSVIAEVQIETISKGGYPPEHKAQIQGNLWIHQRQWWDFISFSDDMPDDLRLYVFRVERDDEYINELDAQVRAFLSEVDAEVEKFLKIARK